MTEFLQTLMDGVTVGCLYALIALGYTLVYGILKFINFAHGDVFALGVWMSITIAAWFGMNAVSGDVPPWYLGLAVLLFAMLFCGAAGFMIERLAYRPLRRAPRLNVLITAIGVSLLMQNVGQLGFVFGPYPKSFPPLISNNVLNERTIADGVVHVGPSGTLILDHELAIEASRQYRLEVLRRGDKNPRTVRIADEARVYLPGDPIEVVTPLEALDEQGEYRVIRSPRVAIRLADVVVVLTAALLMAAMQYLIFNTRIGTAMRAVSFNTRTASLMGINVDRIISFTFVVGSMLAAAAGFLYGVKYEGQAKQTADAMWVMLGLKAFVAAVVGGIGNVRGAVLGGLLIGMIEFFGVVYIGSEYRDAYVFAILILVLLVRPEGVLGRATVEKV